MSINFNDPMNSETKRKLVEHFKENLIDMDEKTAIVEMEKEVDRRFFRELANTAKQQVSLEMHDLGEIKTLSDGTRYQVTPKGWKKLEED